MKHRKLVVLGLLVLGLLFVAQAGMADSSGRYARIRYIDGDVALYPADGQRPSDATINTPILDGDEIETKNGRAEVTFRNGIVIRLGDYSAVQFQSTYSPMTLELLQGTVFVDSHMVDRFGDELEVQAADTQVYLINEGNLRVDLGSEGTVRVTTLDGEAEVRAAGSRVLVQKEQRTYVDPGNPPAAPEAFARNYDELDDWNQARIDEYANMEDRGSNYVNDSIYYDTNDLNNYGDWHEYGDYGNVWVPRMYAGWRPYYDGRWSYADDSWFWISSEPWGWGPYHYGRWDWAAQYGWFWIPGYAFAPAWVSWYDYGDYIGWCPLNYYNYPVYYNNGGYYNGGYGYPAVQKQKTIGVDDSWTFVRKASLGDSNIKRISVSSPEIKTLHIGRDQVLKQPDKGLVKYVAGKGTKAMPGSTLKKSTPITTQQPTEDLNTRIAAPKRGWEFDRDSSNRRTGTTSSSTKQSTLSTSKPAPSTKASTGGSGSSVTKAAPPSSTKKSTGGSSSSVKKPTPPNYNRDDQFQRLLPSNSGYGSKLSRDSVSPTNRDRQFGTSSYQDRQSRDYGIKTYRDSRNYGDDVKPWFQNPDSYNEPGRDDSTEISPRYMEGAKKVFEGYESSRNGDSGRNYSGSRDTLYGSGDHGSSGSRPSDSRYSSPSGKSYGGSGYGSAPRSYGGSPKSYGGSSYGSAPKSSGGTSKGYSGGSVKSAPKASSSTSSNKPH